MRKIAALLLALACAMPAVAAKKEYSYFRVGSPGDVVTNTTAGTVLMGGSTDVDAAFQWMCQLAGNGDFLVIRATGTDAYNPYVYQLCAGVNSVATLIIPTRTAAQDPFVADAIDRAEAVFIAGGDQSNYVNYWKGTPVTAALDRLIARGSPVGGTSAGMNVLTQFVYSALLSQGVTSSQALSDPFNKYMTFDRDFVAQPLLANVIGDPHFAARDRMGRDLAFMCRLYTSGWSPAPRGIAVDEQTALLVEGKGNARVEGAGNAYFLQAPGAPEVCASKTPLTYRNISVYRIGQGSGSFSLRGWSGTGGTAYKVSAEAGVLFSTQSGGSPY